MFLVACTGMIDGTTSGNGVSNSPGSNSPGSNNPGSNNPGSGGGVANPATCQAGTEPHRPPQRVVLLSELEQVNAVRDLLGAEAVAADPGLPTDRGRTLDLDLVNQVSAKSLDTYDGLVTAAGQNVKTRAASLTQCAAGTAADACAKQYAAKLAERAFRRPVADDELTELMAAYQAGAAISPDDGIATLTEAILFAPSAMYRRELGGTPNGQVATLTSWEMADQLSHFLYSSIPDDALVTAAKANSLTTDAGIRGELDRLLVTDRVKQSLSQTMLAWLQTAKLAQVVKDAKYADFGTLEPSMVTETSMFIDSFLWGQPGSLGDLLTSTHTFVDPGLAKFYGVTYPGAQGSTTFMPVDLPAGQRAGILTQASFLSIKAGPDNTSVIFRGLFTHDKVLCLPEIAPPQDAATLMKIAEQQMGVQTEAQKAAYRKQTQPCTGCHAQFDPFGLALEAFDGIGRYRTKDDAGTDIDPSVDLSTFKDYGLDGKVSGIVELAQQVKSSGKFPTCLSSQILTYAANQVLDANDCGVQAVGQSLTQGSDKFTDMVRAIALSPTFRTRSTNGAMP
jgi:Protein of unknown function (DUF1592)/Protein of unknown function (DUF1588)/Protein of unknown function (DUF1595)/Protein of unknown function (DUF1585)